MKMRLDVAFRALPLLIIAVLASGVQERRAADRVDDFVVTAYVPEYSQASPTSHPLSTAEIN